MREGIATPTWADESEWLMVRKDADVHALRIGMAAEELPMYAFNIPVQYPTGFHSAKRTVRCARMSSPIVRSTVRAKPCA